MLKHGRKKKGTNKGYEAKEVNPIITTGEISSDEVEIANIEKITLLNMQLFWQSSAFTLGGH